MINTVHLIDLCFCRKGIINITITIIIGADIVGAAFLKKNPNPNMDIFRYCIGNYSGQSND